MNNDVNPNKKAGENIPGIGFFDIRFFFSKTGRAKYISHLDLYRTVQRALKRAKLDVWETKGFNKHIYLTFPLPLSLGIEGVCETMDMRLNEPMDFDELKERLNSALPYGIRIISVNDPVMKHTAIKKSKYVIETNCEAEKFLEFLKLEKIETEKRTKKKGINRIDLKPYIEFVSCERQSEQAYGAKPDFCKFTLILPSGTEFNINPFLITEAYKKYYPCDFECAFLITRTEITDENGQAFH